MDSVQATMNDSKSKSDKSLNLQLLFNLNDPKHLHGLKTCLKVDTDTLCISLFLS